MERRDEVGYRVGELAHAAGLTVRALHHYDEIGLLVPSGRTDAGHRRYAEHDVERLYRITWMRKLGFSLPEIGRALDADAQSFRSVVAAHLVAVERRLEAGNRLRARLTRLVGATGDSTDPDDPDTNDTPLDLVGLMEDMMNFDTDVRTRISILVYRDIDAAFEHLTDVFGLTPGEITRGPDGVPVHASLDAGDGVVWLHPESEEYRLASPAALGAATATMAIMVDDVDAHHERAAALGADIVYPPVDQPYGYREYSARDPEGGFWSFMKLLDTE